MIKLLSLCNAQCTTGFGLNHPLNLFMSDIFILQNQDKLFLGKQKEWLDGRDPGSLFKTPHKDEAINQMVEISAKDYTQRIKVLSCGLNDKGLPLIPEELLPPPQPKPAKGVLRPLADESFVEQCPEDREDGDGLLAARSDTAIGLSDAGVEQARLL